MSDEFYHAVAVQTNLEQVVRKALAGSRCPKS